jgi:hypothetical protein
MTATSHPSASLPVTGALLLAFRLTGLLHMLSGLLSLLVAVAFVMTLTPLAVLGPVWFIVLGGWLWHPGREVFIWLRRTHLVVIPLAVMQVVYGLLALRAAEESAARGGGLLGPIGLYPLGLGIWFTLLAALTLGLVYLAYRRSRTSS